jgi:hypothetical protein
MSFVLHYNTATTEVTMPFETVDEALAYLAYAIPRKIKEEYSNRVSGLSIPSPRIIEDTILIIEKGLPRDNQTIAIRLERVKWDRDEWGGDEKVS